MADAANNTLSTASSIGHFRGILGGVLVVFNVLAISHLLRNWTSDSKLSKKRLQLAVIATSFFGLILQITTFVEFILVYVVRNMDLEIASKVCHYSILLLTDWFILGTMSSYVVMYLRSSAVLHQVDSSKWVKYLQLFVGVGTCASPSFLTLVRIMGVYNGTLLVDQNGLKFCTTGSTEALNALFVLMDSSVSAGYLILFLYPLNISPAMIIGTKSSDITRRLSANLPAGQKKSKYSSAQQTIIKVAKTNLKWSLLTVVVTFIAVGTGALASSAESEVGALGSSAITAFYLLLATTIDPTVKTLTAMAITNSFPDWSKRIRKRVKIVAVTSTNQPSGLNLKESALFESEASSSSVQDTKLTTFKG